MRERERERGGGDRGRERERELKMFYSDSHILTYLGLFKQGGILIFVG